MKKIFILAVICISSLMTSCKKESLQNYLIESGENTDYTRLDFSTSMLTSFLENTSEENQKTFQTIKKLNIAFLPINKATEEEFDIERKKLKGIMKNTDYKALFRANDKRGKATVYYSGKTDAIKEIVAVVYAKDFGFGVARVLGEDMNPAAIINMVQNFKTNKGGKDLEKIKDIFGGQFQTEKLNVDPIE